MVSLILSTALAGKVPVATVQLDPGTPVHAEHLRWVDLPSDHPMATDALADPVGHIVIERVLEGEILRSERLLDVDKPERIAVPGMRALRVPGLPDDPRAGQRADLWIAPESGACTAVQGTWILGFGHDMDGRPDSTWILVAPEQALAVLAADSPMQVRPVSAATAARPRPEIACSL